MANVWHENNGWYEYDGVDEYETSYRLKLIPRGAGYYMIMVNGRYLSHPVEGLTAAKKAAKLAYLGGKW